MDSGAGVSNGGLHRGYASTTPTAAWADRVVLLRDGRMTGAR